MKLITYSIDDTSPQLGVLVDGHVVNLHQASGHQLPDDMLAFLDMGKAGIEKARQVVDASPEGVGLDKVRLHAPVRNPSKVVAIGLNYMDHVREANLGVPQLAVMFCKYPSAIIGPGDEIRWHSGITEKVDYEAELAFVIGKTARNVPEASAYECIAGYMNCNDVSARDLQLDNGDQWLRGKCLDTFCPLGPYLVTTDEVPDPHVLSVRCMVNGEIRQDSNTREMIFGVPYLVKYLSEAFTLLPGDVVITGTPHGVGAFRKPPVWLKDGDEVVVEVGELGRLTNTCVQDG